MLVTLFSDASICPKRRIGGWATWLKADRGSLRGGAAFTVRVGDSTMGEAMAVVNGLAVGMRRGLIKAKDTVLVQTDNDAVMGVLQGTARRSFAKELKRKRGRSREQVESDVRRRNGEILCVASKFASLTEGHSISVIWRHVKGHRGVQDRRAAVNSFCDRTARAHMRAARGGPDPAHMELIGIEKTHQVRKSVES